MHLSGIPGHSILRGGGGGTRSIHDGERGGGGGGPTELHIANPKKIHKPEILDPKKYLASKFPTPKNTRLNTSILIYSIFSRKNVRMSTFLIH